MKKYATFAIVFAAALGGCSDSSSDRVIADYNNNCKACHAGGINGAPILGNKKMWQPRLSRDETTLIAHANNGFGLMPAKGGSSLSDAHVADIVRMMISRVSTSN
ncbi:Cytochrome c-555 [BD1-7 clade bacterium]|uniref:Cytochrome c-555 n=1 Tax=BD1-7 clade bacterium TaxID=2029982 RepID=A0A5S9QRR7_9GAMM|nr:Cytochrome c-555 [BD1-7 clade bacterium]